MVLQEIHFKRISELPKHKRDELRISLGDDFNKLALIDSLVEIKIASSVPHVESINPVIGTFSDELIKTVGGKIENIFEY